MSERIITTQQTPKIAKLLKLTAVLVAIVGAVILIVADGGSGAWLGSILIAGSLVSFVFARALAWWRTG